MRGSWPHEIVRLLENWSMWVQNGKKLPTSPIAPFPAYRMASRGTRSANVMPILGVDAERTDKIIEAMTPRYRVPLTMHYHWTMRSDRSKALACSCTVNTYKARLNEAHEIFEDRWYGRRFHEPDEAEPAHLTL